MTAPVPERRTLRVRGRVQGVGFRAFVRRHAVALGLSGSVWNDPGGDVCIDVEGPAPALAELERRVRRGPLLARVDAVEVQGAAPVGRQGFDVGPTG